MKRMNTSDNKSGPTDTKLFKQHSTEMMFNNGQFNDDDDDDAPPDLDDILAEENNRIQQNAMHQDIKEDREDRVRRERLQLGQRDADRSEFGRIIPPLSIATADDINPDWGRFKGIQGHYNSCYLDATLFAMFAFTPIFDDLLSRPKEDKDIPKYDEVQDVLRDGIINPLRTSLFVPFMNIMALRQLLDELSSLSGMTTEEKDPEEFLSTLLAQILRTEPFLKMSNAESYFYQLFIEKDNRLHLPTVQQLFEQSFHNSRNNFKQIPSCLLIQMPRFGASYRMYPRIIPSRLLDITDMLENSPRVCSVCGVQATHECDGCKGNSSSTSTTDIHDGGLESSAFCSKCVGKFHQHAQRSDHIPRILTSEKENKQPNQQCMRQYMQLFAVVCIETSHYVSFVKCGMDFDAPWCFFDSMSDRVGEQNGYNIPSITACPDMAKWMSEEENLMHNVPKHQLPEKARRLLSDAYICMYQKIESTDLQNNP